MFFCSEEKPKETYVAFVGEKGLSETELNNYLGLMRYKNKHREEFIRSWIETEVLFQHALSKNLLTDKNYLTIVNQSNKELAGSLLLKSFFEENPITPTETELKEYYSISTSDFSIPEKAIVLNYGEFKNEETAILFREKSLQTNWNNASKLFENDTAVVKLENRKFYYPRQIQSIQVLRALNNLLNDEISIVLQSEHHSFIVVQLVERLAVNEVPKYDYVRDLVRERYLAMERRLLFREYIEKLYSDYNVQIIR